MLCVLFDLNNGLFIFCPTCLGDLSPTITLGSSHTDWLSKRKQGPRAVFLKWGCTHRSRREQDAHWVWKEVTARTFLSFCFKKVSFTKLTVWIVPGYSRGSGPQTAKCQSGDTASTSVPGLLWLCSSGLCVPWQVASDCISSFPKLILTEQTRCFIRKSCKDTSDWG